MYCLPANNFFSQVVGRQRHQRRQDQRDDVLRAEPGALPAPPDDGRGDVGRGQAGAVQAAGLRRGLLRRHTYAAGARPLEVAENTQRRQLPGQVVDIDAGEECEWHSLVHT